VQEIYKRLVLPDVLQLERGITLDGENYVGTIHMIIGDHIELIELAGLPSTNLYPYYQNRSYTYECVV
jgi:hypothetical protein